MAAANGGPVIVAGTGQDAALAALAPAVEARPATGLHTPDACVLVRCAAARAEGESERDVAAPVRPLYLRQSGAKLKAERVGAGAPHG